MATLTGELFPVNSIDDMIHAVGSVVVVLFNNQTVATGVVDKDNGFTIELPDDLEGELEIRVGIDHAAPSLVDSEGGDLHVAIYFNNSNNFLA